MKDTVLMHNAQNFCQCNPNTYLVVFALFSAHFHSLSRYLKGTEKYLADKE